MSPLISRFANLASVSIVVACTLSAGEQAPNGPAPEQQRVESVTSVLPSSPEAYLLGPEDSLSIRVLDAEELGTAPYPIDLRGYVNVPRVGQIKAAGLTINQLQTIVVERLKEYIQNPVVSISVAEYRSQPVSVLGAVAIPGVHQMRGRKTLFEIISEAGGLKTEAGNTIKVTRRKEYGSIPLSGARIDPSGEFFVAEIGIRSIMDAQNPAENISIKPNDVITIPKAHLIYVMGDVKKPGGFPLSERANVSVLEALSLAEGLQKTAGPQNAKILRASDGIANRAEIPINVKRILNGRNSDVPLLADDILFIPNSVAKSITVRAVESAIQIGTGVAVYAHPF